MNTQEKMSLFNPALKAQLAGMQRIEVYKGYRLESEVKHCGMGGNWWSIVVIDKSSYDTLATFTEDAHCEVVAQAKKWVDSLVG
jgi:hypothetical protein